MTHRWRSQVHALLEVHDARSLAKTAVKVLIIAVIAASIPAVALETVEAVAGRYAALFAAIELVVVGVLTIEYVLRLWVAPEHDPGRAVDPWRARLRYAASAFGVIDLVAILPFFLNLLLPINPDWLRVLRLCRLLKVARYVPALALFTAVIRNESRPLLGALLVMAVLLVLSSGVMFLLEREAQPEVFASIPHTMWWAIVTVATVGYGDIAPITAWGKVFGGLVMILGIAMFAVPAGILATGFAVEIRKRDFVVTWQTVAKLPLFAGLEAVRIAEIAGLLRREVIPPRYVVVRRGEPADAMFFIMSGELEADVQPTPRRLGPGQYFGEIALLHDTVRTATVTAVTECQLLALDVADFRRLLDAHSDLKASISRVAERRLATTATTDTGPPGPADGPPT
ncbi:MAG: ion transporter [Candidatus Rokubacteria bacterium]|nr:ion transporter [Candidatus Rokubacteria bacterium]